MYRNGKKRFAALYLALCLMLVGMPAIQAKAAPDAPTASPGLESIAVSGFTSGATLKLYAWTGGVLNTADNVTTGTYTFTNVVPNTVGYYITQTIEGSESQNSNWVNAILRTPTLSDGIGMVDVGNIYPGATVTLYNAGGTEVAASPVVSSGTYRFESVPGGSGYYVVQAINGVISPASNAVSVTAPPRPSAPVAAAGLESITVSGFTSGATLKLYLSSGSYITSSGAVTGTSYTFTSVTPNVIQYYVTQTVDSLESDNSNFVNATLRTPSLLPGIGCVFVSNIFPGANITLYYSSGSIASTSPTDMGGGAFQFNGLNAGEQYYVVQSINGVVSPASNMATTIAPPPPPPPIVSAGVESIIVSGTPPGVAVKLYTWTGSLVASAVSGPDGTYTLTGVVPISAGYYVTQTFMGIEGLNSVWVNSILRTPTVAAGIGYVDVGNIYPGATVTLHAAGGTAISSSPADIGGGTLRFAGVAPGQGYYVVQAINGVVSDASNSVTVQPPAPSVAAGVESLTAGVYLAGATLKLYHWNGSLADTAANVTSASHTFQNVVPDSAGYYITQTFGGVESANSAWVNSLLRAPSIAAGIGYIDVGNLYPGAAVNLYDAGGASVSVTPAANADGTVRYGGLPAGGWYYAVQSINGVVSPASELAGVRSPHSPDAPATANGIESILVSSFVSGATLRLYRWNGTLVATAANVTADAYTFTDIVPWHDGYYVTQTVNGQESVNSPWTVANVRIPVAMAGAGMVNVQNLYPGANLRLYDANHVLISDKPSDNGDGTQRFSGLASGKMYYVKQMINQIASEASNTVSLPAVPNVPLNVKAYAGDRYATVKFDTPLSDGGSPILHYVVTVSPGGKTVTSEKTSVKINGLTNGKQYTFTVKAINAAGESAESAPSNAIKPYNQADTGTSSEQSDKKGQNFVVIVNGVVQDAGTSEIIEQNGKTVLAVTVDNTKLQKILHKTGDHATVLIPIDVKADTLSVIFSGQMLEDMSTGEAVLDIQTSDAIYSVSARNLDLSSLLKQFGQGIGLNEVEMSFIIEEQGDAVVFGPDSVTVKMARFTLVCTYGDETVEVTDVSSFMARKIPIPDGTDPASIKNAIVERQEGVYITEQAEILTENGKTYVVIQ